MLKKEEVYVRVSSEKKALKLKDVLDMFKIEWHINQFENNTFYFENGSLYSSSGAFKRTKVSLKELRNILAREYLKEGDVVLTKNGNDKTIAVVNNTCNSNVSLFEAKRWIRLHDGFKWYNKGCFDDFIRYATEEEKKLLKPQESVIDKATSLLHEVIQGLEELKNK